ncbi:Tad domain-containing protein, partial [Sphingomonas sp.]|uniref:Tad domain-containing protein n=1 Tax=Sphingomonas sp. TaxID=28214 RepID=UPI00286CC33E
MRSLWTNKRGNALLIGAAALPMLVGAAGLASDSIQWVLWKRQLQRTADSAALAGVYAKVASQDVTAQVNADITKNNQTKYALLGPAVIGYPANGANWNNSVSVQLQMQKTLSFTSMFMASAPVITANAT